MTTEQTQDLSRGNGAAGPRVVSDPNEVATIVLMQIDAVNDRKNDLTIAVKSLTDLTKQLVRVYGDQAGMIQALQTRVRDLESALASSVGTPAADSKK